MLRPGAAIGNVCSDASPPPPIPANERKILLPQDQYLHRGDLYPKGGAPTEWWWYVGTLIAGDRLFGLEINAASLQMLLANKPVPYGLTQVMLTDVRGKRHFQATNVYTTGFNPDAWAQTDPTQDWFARLGDVDMSSRDTGHPTREMSVRAKMSDQATATEVTFDLKLQQAGPPYLPFYVWGTGVDEILDPAENPGLSPLQRNNYYYKIPRLLPEGVITIGDSETFEITGGDVSMDHEYGYFGGGHPVRWILQDMQLDNGVNISNYSTQAEIAPGRPTDSCATVQAADGTMYFVKSTVTPDEPWQSPVSKKTYFMKLLVEIPSFNAAITVTSLLDSQEFSGPELGGKTIVAMAIYEGVASARGTFDGQSVFGTAWNEQTLHDPADTSRAHLEAAVAGA